MGLLDAFKKKSDSSSFDSHCSSFSSSDSLDDLPPIPTNPANSVDESSARLPLFSCDKIAPAIEVE